ncbi:hypothetical protein ACHQM5_014483 [Ranunculus cassubicifolius]
MLRRGYPCVHSVPFFKVLSLNSLFSLVFQFRFVSSNQHQAFPNSSQKKFITTNQQQSLKDFEYFIRDRCKSGTLGADEASSMLNRLIQMRPLPSINPFNQIFGAVVKMKRYASVFHLVKMIDSVGVKPNIVTLSILINCCCCVGRVDFGFAVLGNILKLGFEPNAVTLNTLLNGLATEGRVEELMDLFNKILDNGYPCNEVTCGVVINGIGKTVNANAALKLLRMMEKRNLKLDVEVYNMVMDSLCKENLLNDAFTIFEEIRSKKIASTVCWILGTEEAVQVLSGKRYSVGI